MTRMIVCLSGGKASAWCADWAFRHHSTKDIILYFNDTKWEHPDLYRFLKDISEYYEHPIHYDSDGRSPEDLFYDNSALANNRMPFCSRILKAERLQAFYEHDDVIVFGIGAGERHRAIRITEVYAQVAEERNKWPKLRFPLIAHDVKQEDLDRFLRRINVEEPLLYRLGFTHNNCSGGCVRAGKKQWKLLYEKLPEVYAERERVEEDLRAYLEKDIHFLKDETLKDFRGRIERKELSSYYDDEPEVSECIGICPHQN